MEKIYKQVTSKRYPILDIGELSIYAKNIEVCLIQQGRDLTRLEEKFKALESKLEVLKELRS